ncbi:hypothetical protein CENSYa_0990 [Cenarchaeum symbiosum A]|uniref:Uncharacterized protein n=1 Tax=Cenarchaeum symbiosum (strain A) TaxID=414004 RepID=A0RWA5_CENSY|nr:hypothetical protein CENSYa_0990 [Cenarchaeum symbiosum A]
MGRPESRHGRGSSPGTSARPLKNPYNRFARAEAMPRSAYVLAGSAAVLALLALVPAASFSPPDAGAPAFYGMAEMVHRGADGETISSHTVHNRLLDVGEQVTIGLVFGDFDAIHRPSIICITDEGGVDFLADDMSEDTDADDLNPSMDFGGDESIPETDTCIDADIDTSTDTSMAVMTAEFTGGDNLNAGQSVQSIVICTTSQQPVTSRVSCANAGFAFAAIGVPPTLVGDTETLGITYTFDLRSDSS